MMDRSLAKCIPEAYITSYLIDKILVLVFILQLKLLVRYS